jgi:hypothetical protein
MKESTIRDFFLGKVGPEALGQEPPKPPATPGKPVKAAPKTAIDDLDSTFLVTRSMAAKLCDAALSGSLSEKLLARVASSLFGSRRFAWEDPLLTEVIGAWSVIDGNTRFPSADMERQKRQLLVGESLAEREPVATAR